MTTGTLRDLLADHRWHRQTEVEAQLVDRCRCSWRDATVTIADALRAGTVAYSGTTTIVGSDRRRSIRLR